MDMDERKLRILQAIIDDYILTGHGPLLRYHPQ